MQGGFVVLPPGVGVDGVILVIEGNTGTDNVKYCHAMMAEEQL